MQRAIKLNVHVGKDHLVKLPSEFPEGPAEVIVIFAEKTRGFAPLRGQGMDVQRVDAGEVTLAEDFDAPLPANVQRYFDGSDDEQA